MHSVGSYIILCFVIQSVNCNNDKDQLQIIQRASSYVGLGILVLIIIYICVCITAVLYCSWKERCGSIGDDESENDSVVDVRPPNYNEIFKGRQQKFSLDASELPSYEAVIGNFSFAVNSRSSRRSSRISV